MTNSQIETFTANNSLPRFKFIPAVFNSEIPNLREPQKNVANENRRIFTAKDYFDTFNCVIADTDALREESYRLRYQVYCVDNAFEKPEEHPDGLERDEFDTRCVSGLMFHRHTGLPLGTVRNILPLSDNWKQSFSIQTLCKHPILSDKDEMLQSTENSRLCIPRSSRKNICDIKNYAVSTDQPEKHAASLVPPANYENLATTKSLLPYFSLGLFNISLDMALRNHKKRILATIDPRLLQLLTQMGLCGDVLGAPVEYHGLRTPVQFIPINVFENTYKHKREIWRVVSNHGKLHEIALQQK